jgi:hypothetical protein
LQRTLSISLTVILRELSHCLGVLCRGIIVSRKINDQVGLVDATVVVSVLGSRHGEEEDRSLS